MPEPRFWVVTDGACDIPASLEIHPAVVPVHLAFGTEQHDSPGMTNAELYDKLKTHPQHPTTSQPSPEEFAACYRKLTDRPILGIHVSSALSGTFNVADQGRKLVPGADVHLLDSRSVSVGMLFQVYAASVAARLGEPLETAMRWVGRTREETRTVFALETLEYLRKGGRIGRVQAAIGGLLQVKPILEIDRAKGTFNALGRVRGFSRAIEEIVTQLRNWIPPQTPLRVAIGHGETESDADHLLEQLRKQYPLHWVVRAQVGPALAVHSGPRVVGMAVAAGTWPWEQ